MEFVAQEQQISAKQWERKKQLQNILRWILIEGYFVRTIEEVIGANPTPKKTKIQKEPAQAAGAETKDADKSKAQPLGFYWTANWELVLL